MDPKGVPSALTEPTLGRQLLMTGSGFEHPLRPLTLRGTPCNWSPNWMDRALLALDTDEKHADRRGLVCAVRWTRTSCVERDSEDGGRSTSAGRGRHGNDHRPFPDAPRLLEDDGERPSRRDDNPRGKVQNVRGPGRAETLRAQLQTTSRRTCNRYPSLASSRGPVIVTCWFDGS